MPCHTCAATRWTMAPKLAGPCAVARRSTLARMELRTLPTKCCAQRDKGNVSTTETVSRGDNSFPDVEEITKKYGLEAGLWNAWRGNQGNASAKELLKRYGAAYLLTSISFALVSFAFCYLAVDWGVDVGNLLAKINIQVVADSPGEKAGTAAIAYAAHKALSPVRFPPTVALTPAVANWLRNRSSNSVDAERESVDH